MKLKTWNKLKKGDVVRVCTQDELLKKKGVVKFDDFLIFVEDEKTCNSRFINEMFDLFGRELAVLEISETTNTVILDGCDWRFTRKMLAEELL